MAGEIIRMGDRTSHDGTVIEGSPLDICMGKPIAYIGHKVHCPKCKGDYPIVEGAMTATFYGKGVALAGMKTSCGAVLIASQFTDTVDYAASGPTGRTPATSEPGAGKQKVSPVEAAGLPFSLEAVGDASRAAQASFDEQIHVDRIAVGLPYFIVTRDGRTASGRVDGDGLLPRVVTAGEEEYEVFWGDEALARQEGN